MKPLLFLSAVALFVGVMLSGCGYMSAPAPQPMVCPHLCAPDPERDGMTKTFCVEGNDRRACYYEGPAYPGCQLVLGRPSCDADWEEVGVQCQGDQP